MFRKMPMIAPRMIMKSKFFQPSLKKRHPKAKSLMIISKVKIAVNM
jgi:hypothetical protein